MNELNRNAEMPPSAAAMASKRRKFFRSIGGLPPVDVFEREGNCVLMIIASSCFLNGIEFSKRQIDPGKKYSARRKDRLIAAGILVMNLIVKHIVDSETDHPESFGKAIA